LGPAVRKGFHGPSQISLKNSWAVVFFYFRAEGSFKRSGRESVEEEIEIYPAGFKEREEIFTG